MSAGSEQVWGQAFAALALCSEVERRTGLCGQERVFDARDQVLVALPEKERMLVLRAAYGGRKDITWVERVWKDDMLRRDGILRE